MLARSETSFLFFNFGLIITYNPPYIIKEQNAKVWKEKERDNFLLLYKKKRFPDIFFNFSLFCAVFGMVTMEKQASLHLT